MVKFTRVWPYRKVRRTTLIAIFCSSFLAGLGLVQVGWRLFGWVWIVFGLGLLVVCLRKKQIAILLVAAAGIIFGVVRGTDIHTQLYFYQAHIGQKVTLIGTVIDDAQYGNKGQRDMRVHNVRFNGRGPPGAVRVTSFTLAQPRRGDTVQVTGKLYDGFGNYQAAVYFGELSILQVNTSPVEQLRHAFAASVYSNVPDPQASLGLGVLVGIKSQLPDSLNDQLKVLSLTHIVVASGYNLTVLVRLARRVFERRSKYQTALVGAMLMGSFVVVTGFSASMSRAALVSGLSLLAWYYGRRIHPVTLLVFAAALTAGINPLYVWSDIGWWLSFLAFTGVLILAPLLQHRLFGARPPRLIGQLVTETLAAQILTLPLLLAIFGTLPVLGLLANILVVPLIPLAMLCTFVAGIAGVCAGVFAPFIALPASWLLTYITQVVSVMAGVPWASVPFTVTAVGMVALYFGLAALCLMLWRKTKHDFLARSVIE